MQPLEKVRLTENDKRKAKNDSTLGVVLTLILAIGFDAIAIFLVDESHFIIRPLIIIFFTLLVVFFIANKIKVNADVEHGEKLVGKMRINNKYVRSSSDSNDEYDIKLVDAENKFDLNLEIKSSKVYEQIKVHDQVDIEFLEKSKHILRCTYNGISLK